MTVRELKEALAKADDNLHVIIRLPIYSPNDYDEMDMEVSDAWFGVVDGKQRKAVIMAEPHKLSLEKHEE